LDFFFKKNDVTLLLVDADDNANKCFFALLICRFISARPPCSMENIDLHNVQNTLPTSSVSLKNENSDFKFGVKTHLLLGIMKNNENK